MRKIKSKIVDIPDIYWVETDEDVSTIPRNIPYLVGSNSSQYDNVKSYLEVLSLHNAAKATGFPFKWDIVFKKNGHDLSAATGNIPENIQSYIRNENIILTWEKLIELRVLPTWLETLESSIRQDLVNSIRFNPSAFNKRTGLWDGSSEYYTATRNLIVFDLSSSMGDSLPTSMALLAKTMGHRLYADVIFTSAESYFYPYETLGEVDFEKEAVRVGKSNERTMFLDIVSTPRKYNTVIGFGDTDQFSYDDKYMFKCNEVIGFFRLDDCNKKSNKQPGYIQWAFEQTKKQTIITDWFETLV